MAAPSYTEDLTDITLSESTTDWTALGGGASGLGVGSDFAMQGTNCVDKQVSAAEKGQIYNNGATITPGANTHFFVWVFLATPGLANTLANRGLGIVAGTATNAYNTFHVEGSDTYGAAGRVAKCYPIRYVNTALGTAPYRTLTGSPGANPQYFGATANITGTVKGANLGVDAIRYGTGGYITAGDSGTPATFNGFAAQNDSISNRWGILTAVGGGYELQGRFVIGQTNAGTPTLAYFSDSNKVISIVNTPHSLTDFTQIIVDHASTELYWTNITLQALGTNNPGRLVFNNASTIAEINSCTFSSIGTTVLRAGVTVDGTTWRNSRGVTQNGATITNSNFITGFYDEALLSDNPALISNCAFETDGFDPGHAIEITTPGTYTFTGNTFTGFTTGTSAAIYNNSGGAVTLNIAGGGDTPTIRNGTGASTTVNNNTSITLSGLPTSGVEVRIYNDTGTPGAPVAGTEIAGNENVTAGTFNFSAPATDDIIIVIFDTENTREGVYQQYTVPTSDATLPFTLLQDRNYLNP